MPRRPKTCKPGRSFRTPNSAFSSTGGSPRMLGSGEWTMTNRDINYREYAKLANAFYPHDFDAAEWVSAIKSSGAGYVCFTTRHHDGFSMWDTAQTDYDIVDATPYEQDVVKGALRRVRPPGHPAAPLLFADRLVPRRLPARAAGAWERGAPARRSQLRALLRLYETPAHGAADGLRPGGRRVVRRGVGPGPDTRISTGNSAGCHDHIHAIRPACLRC